MEPTHNITSIELPQEVTTPLFKIAKDIDQYGLFMSDNQIWLETGEKKKYFKSVSNFKISIILHLHDDKFPSKLIKISNVRNEDRIFDVPANALSSLDKLQAILANQGNYVFSGSSADFKKLTAFLYDKMNVGKKIEVLGWQEIEKFWVWNNRVNLCNGNHLEIDKYGCFTYNHLTYNLPSANRCNSVYNSYEAQKKFIYIKSEIDIKNLFTEVLNVHGTKSISAILFSIASIFSDFIYSKVQGFPILFLYGGTGSGKSQLAFFCQRFFGKEQTPYHLENGVSTKVASVRELAQFKNGIGHLSEYKPNLKDIDGLVKGIWDRNGYKRGVRDSRTATEEIPISSAAIITGNYYPNDEALITRLIWIEINKNEHNDNEKIKYQKLEKLMTGGLSFITDQLLENRSRFEKSFYDLYNQSIIELPKFTNSIISRLDQNLSILLATYKVFEKDDIFPFTENEILAHFEEIVAQQISKLNTNSKIKKWWECFLICYKSVGFENKIVEFEDFRINGNLLYFNFSNIYGKIQRQWSTQYKSAIPSNSDFMTAIKESKDFIEIKANFRIRSGSKANPTSVYCIDLSKNEIHDDFFEFKGSLDNRNSII